MSVCVCVCVWHIRLRTWLVSIRMPVWSLALLSGLRIGVRRRCTSDLGLLWLWCRLPVAALIWPLFWERPYASVVPSPPQKKRRRKKCVCFLLFKARKDDLKCSGCHLDPTACFSHIPHSPFKTLFSFPSSRVDQDIEGAVRNLLQKSL